MSGHWIRWYENGQKLDEGEWSHGKPEGQWQTWHSDGRQKSRIQMKDGAAVCSWLASDEGKMPQCPDQSAAPRRMGWGHFQLTALGIFESSGGNTFSPELEWNPTFQLNQTFSIRGSLALALLKNPQNFFPAATYQTLLAYDAQNWAIELGGGLQTWIASNGGTGPIGSLGLARKVQFGWIDRVFARYSSTPFPNPVFSHEFRFGFGVSL